MDICPHCGAPGSFDDSSDGRCPVCGMVLPLTAEHQESEEHQELAEQARAGHVESVVAGTERPVSTLVPADLPASDGDPPEEDDAAEDTLLALPEAEDDGPHGEELIQPRKLSPEYERRVAAGWKQTHSQFKSPKETLKFEPKTGGSSKSGSGSGSGSGSASRSDSKDGGSKGSGAGDLGDLQIGERDVRGVEEPGEKDYELKEIIGQGAMGVVWSARQASLDRDVAIKMPKDKVAKSGSGRRQFMAEVVVTGQLDHPNIVPIYDLAKDASGQLFYSMKQVEGRAWNELLEEKSQSLHQNLEILMKVCDAIRFAHDRGVIHRDIKPHNVMVGSYGEVSVMDWGIALRLDVDGVGGGATRISPAGTPAYMAPEMATGSAGDIGPATDVYLLGAVLYEIVTGNTPHPPPTDSANRLEVVNSALLIAARNQITPIAGGGELAEICYRAMATDVENRYQKVDEFQAAIREYLAHAESIQLTKRGEQSLARAKANGKSKSDQGGHFDDFDRARYAFEESIAIWPGNRIAQARLDETHLAYANYAYEEGAYTRGIALLSDANPAHKSLLRKLRAAQRRTSRLSMLLKAAVLLILVGTAVFSAFLYMAKTEADSQRLLAEDAKSEAVANEQRAIAAQQREQDLKEGALRAQEREKQLKEDALAAQEREKQLKEDALAAQEREKQLKEDAIAAQKREEKLKELAIAKEAEAEAASYANEIGLAAEELQRNAFSRVKNILDTQTQSEAKSPLRNWEWGYLNALVNLDSQEYEDRGRLLQGRVETSAISPDGAWVAAGTGSGDVYLWKYGGGEQPVRIRYGEATNAVAFSPDGKTLLAGGRVSDGRYSVKAWSLPARDGAEADREIVNHDATILSLDVAGELPTVLSASADGEVLLTSLNGGSRFATIQANIEENSIWSARFSPDGAWIVTAGEDGSVKVYNTREVSNAEGAIDESLRLNEHGGDPVYTAAFSPDGRFIVSGGRDRRVLATPFDPSQVGESFSRTKAIENRLMNVSSAAGQSSSKSVLIGEQDAPVRSVSFTSDGSTLFSSGHDHTVRVWDLSQGFTQAKLAKTLRGHGGWVRTCVAVPGDPNRVLSAGYDRRVKNWNLEKYAFPEVLKHASNRQLADSELTASAVSPNGKWVAAASAGGVVTMWDMQNPDKPQATELAEGHDWQATTGVYFAGGRKLLTAGGDNTALVWDEARGNELVRMGGWNKPIGAGWRGVAAASSDGRWIATGADGEVVARIWNAETGELITSILTPAGQNQEEGEGPQATALDFSPSGDRLAIGDQWGTVYLASPSNNWQATPFRAHEAKVAGLKFLPSGDALLTASSDGTVQEWTMPTAGDAATAPQSQATFQHDNRVVAMDLSVDGTTIITAISSADGPGVRTPGSLSVSATDNDPQVLMIWDRTQPDRPIKSLGLTDITGKRTTPGDKNPLIRSVSLHPSEKVALVSVFDPENSTYRIGRWSWTNDKRSYLPISNRLLRDVSTALFSPNRSNSILTVGGRGARRQTLGPRTTTVAMSYRPQSAINAISFSADNNRMVSASEDGSLKVWILDPQSRQWKPEERLVGQHAKAVNSVQFHPTRNDLFLTASDDGSAKLWSLRDGAWEAGQTLNAPGEKPAPVYQAVFIPSAGEVLRMATAGDNGAFLWEGAAAPVRLPTDGPASCIAVTPDGDWIVVSAGAKAKFYNAATAQPASAPLEGHSAEITGLAFTPDGSRLFTTSRDTTVKLWDTQPLLAGSDATPNGATPPAIEQERELLTLEGHSDEVTSITVAAVGKHPFVMTTGLDGQAILWPNRAAE